MSQHSTRIISFDISEGLETVIGKADKNDESRSAKVDNLLYEDDELSERHAKIVIKRLDEGKRDIYSAVEFLRIYLEDLSGCGSGIVDLETANAETSLRFIDLKNGDRFGLIRKDDPLFDGQSRGAKIKLRLALRHGNQTNPNRWGLVVSDVSDQRSPCASRSNNLQDYTPKDLTPSPFLPQDLSQDLNWETESGSDLSFMRPISSSDSETTSGSDFSAENDTKEAEKIKLKPIEALKPFSIINMLTDDVESTTFFPDNTPHETVAAEKNDQDGQCGESNHKKPLKLASPLWNSLLHDPAFEETVPSGTKTVWCICLEEIFFRKRRI